MARMSEYAITPAGLEALKAELEHLQTVERRAIADRIRTAREWGDLKENAEYHDAKNSQGMLERRISILDDRLRNAEVIEEAVGDAVVVGQEVEAVDESSGRTLTYRLVGAAEADAKTGKLSVASPVGQALIGARVGDAVAFETPRGERTLRVQAIRP
jgi:transcription elongation factor GreA